MFGLLEVKGKNAQAIQWLCKTAKAKCSVVRKRASDLCRGNEEEKGRALLAGGFCRPFSEKALLWGLALGRWEAIPGERNDLGRVRQEEGLWVARTPVGSTDLCRGPWLLTWKGPKWKAGVLQLFKSLLTLSVISFISSKSWISECKIITLHASFWRALATLEFQVSGKQTQVHPGTVSIGLFIWRNVFMSLPVLCT